MNTQLIKSSALVGSLMVGAILFTGCGSGSFVKKASVEANVVNAEVIATVMLGVDTGKIKLPNFSEDIPDPLRPWVTIGQATLRDSTDPAYPKELVLDVNLTRIAMLQVADGHFLPNGSRIPVGGLDNVPVLQIPIPFRGMSLYVSLTQRTAMVGLTLPVKEFALVGQYVGQMNYFYSFKVGKVQGAAGIYTSSAGIDKNGLGFFVDASALLQTTPLLASQLAHYGAVAGDETLTFNDVLPSAEQKSEADRAILDLSTAQNGKPVTIGE